MSIHKLSTGIVTFILVFLYRPRFGLLDFVVIPRPHTVWVAGADLTGGHSCSGRRGPWEAGPWRPLGLGGPGRLNFGLQSPDCNLNGIYDLFKLETSTLIWRSVLSEF